jgi:hypothetical protein
LLSPSSFFPPISLLHILWNRSDYTMS